MVVQPVGEAVFKAAGQTHCIAAAALRQHDLVRNSSGILKEEAEDWSVSFTAAHEVGELTWLVSFSLGVAGVSLDSVELVRQPPGTEMLSNMAFELVDDED